MSCHNYELFFDLTKNNRAPFVSTGCPKKTGGGDEPLRTFAGSLVLVEAGLEGVEVAAEVVVLQLVAQLPHGGQLVQQGAVLRPHNLHTVALVGEYILYCLRQNWGGSTIILAPYLAAELGIEDG